MITERTFELVLSNLIMVALLYWGVSPSLKGRFNKTRLLWIYPLMLIFCLFSFWGPDWFHYLESYELLKRLDHLPSQLEPVYRDLIALTPNYLFYRLAIWGPALVTSLIAFKVLRLDMGLATFFFVVCSLIWFSYGRVSLAFGISTLGVAMMVIEHKKVIFFPLGVFLVLLSIYFHKSSIYIVGIVGLTYMMERMPSGIYKTMLFLFPFFAVMLSFILGNFLSVMVAEDSDLAQTMEYGQRYLSGSSSGMHFKSLGQIPSKFLEWIPKYILAYICLQMIKHNKSETPRPIMFFCIMIFLIMYTASFFFFDLGYSTSTIFSRFQRYSIVPEVVVMTYLCSSGMYTKLTTRARILFITSTFYTLMYQTYCAYHGA